MTIEPFEDYEKRKVANCEPNNLSNYKNNNRVNFIIACPFPFVNLRKVFEEK